MEQKLNDVFQTLRDEEIAQFLPADFSEPTEEAFNVRVLRETLRKAGLAPAGKDMTMKQKKQSTKWLRTLLIAALIAAVAAVGAFAAVHFNVPQAFIEQLGLTGQSGASVSELPQSIETNGFVITLEAILDGNSAMPRAMKNETGMPKADRTYAIVSVRRTDGSRFFDTGDDARDFHGWNFGYTLLVNGFSPNANMFVHDVFFDVDTKTNTVWRAYDITDAQFFADKGVSLVVSQTMITGPEALRIDKNGDFYWADGYDGIKAIFPLPFDKTLADSEKQAKLMDDTWHTYDEIAALFCADGLDYDNYVPTATESDDVAVATTVPAK